MSLRIAFIGYGEVGQLFAGSLAARPDVQVTVYDILFEDGVKGPQLRKHAEDSGVHAAGSIGEACEGADIVISAVTADAAVTAAEQAAPSLGTPQIYIDLNSVSPATKEQAAAMVRGRGADFVEFAVMAPVSEPGIQVPILSGGQRAEEVSRRLNTLGMKITPVSTEIGTASAT